MYQYTIQKNVDAVKDVGVISARKTWHNDCEISFYPHQTQMLPTQTTNL